jgi:DNA-binding FadR family transcriptional regulator
MAKNGAQRMRELRERQKASGLVTMTLTMPAADVHFFRDMAARACKRATAGSDEAEPDLTAEQERLAFRWAATSGLKARIGKRGASLGDLLAKNLAVEIRQMGFPIGRRLGSESELMERNGVSRSVLREAIRILEQQTVAAMTKGSEGGLIVTEQRQEAAAYLGGLYLEYCRINADQIHEIRKALELIVIECVIERLTPAGEQRLRALLDAEEVQANQPRLKHFHRFHLLLAELADNPALSLFLDIVLREFRLHNRGNQMAEIPWDAQAAARKAHRRIANAVIARDVEKARAEMSKYLGATITWISENGVAPE